MQVTTPRGRSTTTAHITVAAEVSNTASDAGQLLSAQQAVQTNTDHALADAGYRSEKDFADLAD